MSFKAGVYRLRSVRRLGSPALEGDLETELEMAMDEKRKRDLEDVMRAECAADVAPLISSPDENRCERWKACAGIWRLGPRRSFGRLCAASGYATGHLSF